jgi:hypothetical protein
VEKTIVLSLAYVQDVFWVSFVAPFAGFLGGFVTAILAEPLRQRFFRAQLKLEFDQSSPFLVEAVSRDLAGEQDKYEMQFIRIKVTNIKRHLARSCRAFLINVEKENGRGVFEQTHYYDSLQLTWASETHDPFREIDLPNGINKYIDVISTRSDRHSFYPHIEFSASRLAEELFTEPGTFRFTILVSGDGIDPEVAKLVFSWKGVWNNFAVHKE